MVVFLVIVEIYDSVISIVVVIEIIYRETTNVVNEIVHPVVVHFPLLVGDVVHSQIKGTKIYDLVCYGPF